jgi:hypothetical protein
MNKENIRKELKRLDSLIFETRMCLSVIEREFYGGITITNEYGTVPLDKHDESGEEFYEGQYTGEAVLTNSGTLAAYNSTNRTKGQRSVVLPE